MNSDDFLPTASLKTLGIRAEVLACLRAFFHLRKYMEVETPLLSHETVVDAHLDAFVTSVDNSSSNELFLQTSPEASMKRLLAAGAGSIYQITRSFRKGESGVLHNPEFTIVEWYQPGDRPNDQMTFIEEMIHNLVRKNNCEKETGLLNNFERMSYDEIFEKYFGMGVLGQETELIIEKAIKNELLFPESFHSIPREQWDRDDVLNFILAELIEPELGKKSPLFVYDYPPSQAALAKINKQPIPVAERFELYYKGIELCNGYHELTDPVELSTRTEVENRKRADHGLSTLPAPERLIQAMKSGIPECTGVALGFDRLLMLMLNKSSIQEVMAFPISRA